MNLETLVANKLWIKYFFDGKEIIPFTFENNSIYLKENPKWSLIYQKAQ